MTYNTHLFGDPLLFQIGDIFENLRFRDDDRKQALKAKLSENPADIVFLQEVWSGAFADNIKEHGKSAHYPNFFAANTSHGEINRFGLIIMTVRGVTIKSAKKFSFSDCLDMFSVDPQDAFIDKGIIHVVCGITSEFDSSIPAGQEVLVGLFCTHFMTNQSTEKEAADCSYQRLTEVIQRFQEEYPQAAVILGGDFNNSPRSDKYARSFENLVLPATGLVNAFDAQRELDVIYYNGSGDPKPIGEWKLDEPSGSLIDSTGNHEPATPKGTPSYRAVGVPKGTYGSITVTSPSGSSIEFGPSTLDENFLVPFTPNNEVMHMEPNDTFTVMGWINAVANDLGKLETGYHRLLSTGGLEPSTGGWTFGLSISNPSGIGSRIRFTPHGSNELDSDRFNLSPGEFVHVAVVYQDGRLRYFINGNAIGGSTNIVRFVARSAVGQLVIGGRAGGLNADQMSSQLDGLRVYKTRLTEAQIRTAAANSVSGNTVNTIATLENFNQDLSRFAEESTRRSQNPGYTIDKLHNRMIIALSGKVEEKVESPDHLFFAGGNQSQLRLVKDRTTVITNWSLGDGMDLSDHYPLYTELELHDPRLAVPSYKFGWAPDADVRSGNGSEADGELRLPNDYNTVLVGAGGRVSGQNFVTLRLYVAHIRQDGTLSPPTVRNFGSDAEGPVEVEGKVGAQEVIVGIGLRASEGNLTTMALFAKRLDPTTGKLVPPMKEYRFGSSPKHDLEKLVRVDEESRIATGFAARAHDNNIEGLVLHTGRLSRALENPKGYQVWKRTMFPENQVLTESISDPDADPDEDGVANVMEFAFGSNPLKPDATNRWAISVTTNAADQRRLLQVKVPRNINAEGVEVIFEEASSLSTQLTPKFAWRPSTVLTSGTGRESQGKLFLPNQSTSVLVGAGGRFHDNNFVTLHLHVAPILADGTIGDPHIRRFGRDSGGNIEASGRVGPQEVMVGIGFAASGGNITAMRLYAKRLDPKTGKLVPPMKEYRFGSDRNRNLERVLFVDDNSRLAIGFGARGHDNNIEGLELYTGILGEGPVGPPDDTWTPIISNQGNATISQGSFYDISLKLPRVDQSRLSHYANWPLTDKDVSSANVFVRARAILKSAQ